MFGLVPGDARGSTLTIVPPTKIHLPMPGVTFITGPSGAGKSTLLGLIAEACRSRGVRVLTMREAEARAEAGDSPIIDRIATDQPLQHAMELLSFVGLGDAFVMLRSAAELSDGQRFRFHVALLLTMTEAAAQPTLIVIDEFAATLDRTTARNLAGNIRRWSDRTGSAFLLATTHDDLLKSLQPDLLIHKGLGDAIRVMPSPRERDSRRGDGAHHVREPKVHAEEHAADDCENDDDAGDGPSPRCTTLLDGARIVAHVPRIVPAGDAAPTPDRVNAEYTDGFRIEPGTLDDFRALAAFHYRSHHPGAATSVLRLPHRDEPAPVGVLVRSLPALACGLRDRALRNRYVALSPRERGVVLNREIRCISRVVIEPRFRGLGLAVRLVRFALEHSENESLIATEALAAMGRISPFFERAGMRRFDHAPSSRPAYERYEAALRTAELSPTDATPPADGAKCSLLVREARRFLRATRRLDRETLAAMSEEQLFSQARMRLLLCPTYYLFMHDDPNRGSRSEVGSR